MTPPVVLAIAATDSGGGAGLSADLATFAALGVHGTCVVTAVTAQDTTGLHAIHRVPIKIIAAQLDAVLDDLTPSVIKTGMLGTAAVARLVADRCAGFTLVVDPVLRASTGASLADQELVAAYREHLLPIATAVTPNADEDAALGHPQQPGVVITRGGNILTRNDHGTGCTFASALAAHLALGADLRHATSHAHAFVARQLTLGLDWDLGAGRGPVAHISTSSMTEVAPQ
jgi:hydroxymethylpyrimidine/phosphomethylpyrimidine kinase